MTTHLLRALLISSLATAFLGCTNDNTTARPANPAHMGPIGSEVPKSNLQTMNTQNEAWGSKPKLQPILDMGQRAVAWLNLVNLHRDLDHRLNLADRKTKNPVPPEKPNLTSVKILLEKLATRTSEIPEEMKPFLVNGQELVETPPVADEVFLKSIRDLNSVYQGAVRWLGEEPYFLEYEANNIYDIRGIYFMKKDADIETKIKNFAANTPEDIVLIKNWLVSICHNSEKSLDACTKELALAEKNQTVFDFYQSYIVKAKKTYDDFFTVNPVRKDITWSADGQTLTQNFIDPNVAKVANWLKTNIEEEWKATGFQLIINFVKENPISPYIEFVKGVTPHVSGENWEKVTMDPDYSLDDYNTQWTIRHEFGHILGFPDCYLEFYNSKEETMTYYTIETDNLMCAWGGKLQPSHPAELRRAYK